MHRSTYPLSKPPLFTPFYFFLSNCLLIQNKYVPLQTITTIIIMAIIIFEL